MIGIFQLRGDLTQTIVTSRPITDGVMLCGPQPCCPPPNWRLSGLSCFEYCTRFSVFPSGSPTLRMFPLSDPPPVHFSPIFCFLLLKIDHFNFPSIRFTDYYYFSSAVQIGLRPPRVDCSCQLLYFSGSSLSSWFLGLVYAPFLVVFILFMHRFLCLILPLFSSLLAGGSEASWAFSGVGLGLFLFWDWPYFLPLWTPWDFAVLWLEVGIGIYRNSSTGNQVPLIP